MSRAKKINGFCIRILFLSGLFISQARALEIAYKISIPNPADHYFHIQIDLRGVNQEFLDLQMPAWSPGRYLILNFARNISDVTVKSASGALPFYKIDKQTWRIQTQGSTRISVQYKSYGNNLSGELSLVNDKQAFLDGVSLYMYVVGYKDIPVSLEVIPPAGWMILSSAGELGQTAFSFPHYDLMIDELVQMGTFFVERFTIGGTEFRVSIVTDTDRALIPNWVQKVQLLGETAVAMLGSIDSPKYTFFYHFLPDSRDSAGMEHFNCCQLTRKHALSDTGSMMALTLWVTAHELMHAWNGKRLRPQNLGPFDYTREVYTNLLWFEEGMTSYLADLILIRSGLWTKETFYKQFADQITAFRSSPGIYQRSPEEASFDIWLWPIDSSRESDWNNTWTSFYISGELLGLCIDLEIRQRTKNQKKLEDFFLLLYDRFYRKADQDSYYAPGKGYVREDIQKALEDTTQSPWDFFISTYIAQPGDIPFSLFLGYAGLLLQEQQGTAPLPYTGLHLITAYGSFPQSSWIDQRSPAAVAGLSDHDILIALDGERVLMRDFNDVLRRHSLDDEIQVTFLRDNRLLETTLELNSDFKIVNYEIIESNEFPLLARQIREDWLRPYNQSTSVEWKQF